MIPEKPLQLPTTHWCLHPHACSGLESNCSSLLVLAVPADAQAGLKVCCTLSVPCSLPAIPAAVVRFWTVASMSQGLSMLCAVLVQDANELHRGLEMPPAMHPLPFMPFDEQLTPGSIAASEGRLRAAGMMQMPQLKEQLAQSCIISCC